LFDSGVGQTNLTRDEVLNCPLIVPKERAEQIKILNFIKSADDKIEVVKIQLEQTLNYKRGLLQKMFV
jgi:type I restriction enzyme, S subunit